jgi:hypothetical protein
VRRAAATLLLALGCDAGTATTSGGPPLLPEADFDRSWVLIDHLGSGKTIDAVTSGSAGYLAITHLETLDAKAMPARNNIAALSPDGVNWSEVVIQPDGHYRSVAFGAGLYVAVGGQFLGGGAGLILTSTDGRLWRTAAQPSSLLRRVRFTAGGFVAVGDNAVVVTSPDGVAWSETHVPAWGLFWDGTFGAGRFVAAGQSLAVSGQGGGGWSQLSCGPQLPCMTVVDPSGGAHGILELYTTDFGNGAFLATGVAGLLRSTDGLSWTRAGEARDPLVFTEGRFLALAPLNPQDGSGRATAYRLSSSSDGVTWTERTTVDATRTDATCTQGRCLVLPHALLLIPPRH